jgi:hypothetical protein
MNAFDPNLGKSGGPATLHYGDGEFAVMSPGQYVLCAVTGAKVALEACATGAPSCRKPMPARPKP